MVRGHKVLLDSDLAELYGVSTKRLNEVVKRNPDRFDDDFAFRLGRAALDADTRRRFDEVHAAIRTLMALPQQKRRSTGFTADLDESG